MGHFVICLAVVLIGIATYRIPTLQGVLLTLAGILVSLKVEAIKAWTVQIDEAAARQWPGLLSKSTRLFSLFPWDYTDLFGLTLAIFWFDILLFNSFQVGLDRLVSDNAISFKPQANGEIALQMLIVGLIFLTSLFVGLGIYGFNRGLRGSRTSILKVAMCLILGYAGILLITGVNKAASAARQNSGYLNGANGDPVLHGLPMSFAVGIVLVILLLLGLALYIWIAAKVGELLKYSSDRITARLKSGASHSTG